MNCSRALLQSPEWSNVQRASVLSSFLYIEVVAQNGQLTSVLRRWQRRQQKAKSTSKLQIISNVLKLYFISNHVSWSIKLVVLVSIALVDHLVRLSCVANVQSYSYGTRHEPVLFINFTTIEFLDHSAGAVIRILLIRAGIESNPGPSSRLPEFRLVSQNCRGLTDCRKTCHLVKKLADLKPSAFSTIA